MIERSLELIAFESIRGEFKVRHFVNCAKSDLAYGEGMVAALNIPMSEDPTE